MCNTFMIQQKRIAFKLNTFGRKEVISSTATTEAAMIATAIALAGKASVVGCVRGKLTEPTAAPHWGHGTAEAHHAAGPERRRVHRKAAVVVPGSSHHREAASHRVGRGTTEPTSAAICITHERDYGH